MKENLQQRWNLLRATREFFWSQGYTEVETPNLLEYAGQEPYLDPLELKIHTDRKQEHAMYLHTSPEYAMKKMLAQGSGNIFSLPKVYRDFESCGGLHNIEFTMLEFYQVNADIFVLMDRCQQLVSHLSQKEVQCKRISMKQLWQEIIQVNLDDYLDQESMQQLCKEKEYQLAQDEPYEDLFYRIFLNEIEPKLPQDQYTFVYHYPAAMAALAKIETNDPRYASRFELYYGSLELGNGFHELSNAKEQASRFAADRQSRKSLGKTAHPVDPEFLECLERLPNCSGIAIGFDRLVMALLGCQDIKDVIPSTTLKYSSI